MAKYQRYENIKDRTLLAKKIVENITFYAPTRPIDVKEIMSIQSDCDLGSFPKDHCDILYYITSQDINKLIKKELNGDILKSSEDIHLFVCNDILPEIARMAKIEKPAVGYNKVLPNKQKCFYIPHSHLEKAKIIEPLKNNIDWPKQINNSWVSRTSDKSDKSPC